ncbi:unnamed protein product [Medioppia subpectinata]|uniref:C2H2-type domain-containing protein n=1 Tax=Medioppia subpectinata TaxID=1979941 RepID=A0A7R9L5R3_9ACAR|nr:unnamed protein product [Medioppia subpectinata]CAG2115834.1 unnamed protein product [Medioppia subpectinata]
MHIQCPQTSHPVKTTNTVWNQLTHIYHTFTHDIKSFNTSLEGQLNSERNHLIQRLTQQSHPRSGSKKTRKLKDNNPKTTTTTPKRRYNKQKKTISEELDTNSDHNWDTISAMKREVVDNTDETMVNSKPEKCGGSDGTTRYRCHWEGCDKSFTQKPNLVGHIRSTHTKERPFRCEECGKRFTTETILKLHDRTHQSVKRYKCGHNGCAFETNTPNTLKCHRLRHSTAPAPYRCQIDGCGREFFYRHVMVRHQRSKAHNPEAEARALALKYACEWPGCGKRVHSRDVLVAHVRLRHTNEKPFKCDECDKQFPTERYLAIHHKWHRIGKRLRCSYKECPYETHRADRLAEHQTTHDGTRRVKCTQSGCDRMFVNLMAVKKHCRVFHVERQYACEWPGCEARFKSSETLKRHQSTHLGIKQFVCDIEGCGKGFVTKSYLYQHKNQHTLPYVCSWPACDRRYGAKDKLTDHMNSHQGLRVVDCPVEGCDKTFTCKPSARQHLRQFHKLKTTEGLLPKK